MKPRPKAAGAFCPQWNSGFVEVAPIPAGRVAATPGQARSGSLYQSKLMIARSLLREWVKEHPHLKLPVTFDQLRQLSSRLAT